MKVKVNVYDTNEWQTIWTYNLSLIIYTTTTYLQFWGALLDGLVAIISLLVWRGAMTGDTDLEAGFGFVSPCLSDQGWSRAELAAATAAAILLTWAWIVWKASWEPDDESAEWEGRTAGGLRWVGRTAGGLKEEWLTVAGAVEWCLDRREEGAVCRWTLILWWYLLFFFFSAIVTQQKFWPN